MHCLNVVNVAVAEKGGAGPGFGDEKDMVYFVFVLPGNAKSEKLLFSMCG